MKRVLFVLLMLSFLIAPVFGAGTYQPASPQLLASSPVFSGKSLVLTSANGPAFTHCNATAFCAMSQGFTWANTNGMILPILLDHVVVNAQIGSGTTPSGNAQVGLFAADTNGVPTSTTALATSGTVALSSVFSVSGNTATSFTFSGANQIALAPGTNYAVVVEDQNTTNWAGSNYGTWTSSGGVACSGSGTEAAVYKTSWVVVTECGMYQVWGDPPTVQGTITNGSYYYSTMFSFFGVIIALGMIFNREQPIVKKYGARAIVILGLALAVMWITGLVING